MVCLTENTVAPLPAGHGSCLVLSDSGREMESALIPGTCAQHVGHKSDPLGMTTKINTLQRRIWERYVSHAALATERN